MDAIQEQITEEAQEPAQEKLLTQSQVNAIVQREKQQAAERATRKAEANYQQQVEQMNQQQQAPAQQQAPQQVQPQVQPQSEDLEANKEAMFQQFQERMNIESQQKRLEEEVSQVAQNYLQKMSAGKDSHEDFEAITADFDPSAFPQLVYLVAGVDNAADIIYELSKNPSKLVTLDALALKSPQQAQAELGRLSKSITDNKQAQADANGQQVSAPLDRMQPSRVNSSGGQMSIKDLRSQDWLRG